MLMRRSRFLVAAVACAAPVAAYAEVAVREEAIVIGGTLRVSLDADPLNSAGFSLTGSPEAAVPIDSASLQFAAVDGDFFSFLGGQLNFSTDAVVASSATKISFGGMQLVAAPRVDLPYDFYMVDSQGQVAFVVAGGAIDYSSSDGLLRAFNGWIRVSDPLAARIGNPNLAGDIVGRLEFDAVTEVMRQIEIDDVPGTHHNPTGGDGDDWNERVGPDVALTDSTSISNYGVVGSVRAFAIGSNTCNYGNQNLLWTNNGTPSLAMNMFRLHNGRLMQIGQSWCKTACCAAAGNGCGMACNGQGGAVLGAGCLDVYGSSWNGGQGRLKQRALINAYSGAHTGATGVSGDAAAGRLQVATADLDTTVYAGALWFMEGVYAASDDASSANWLNNATYKRLTNASNGATMSVVAGVPVAGAPAIKAWRLNGLGVGMVDTRVEDAVVAVPSEGTFHVASKVTDLGGGTWRYDYAIYNLNSDRSGGSFSVPIPAGTTITNVGFNDVAYHSGEPFANTDWTSNVGSTSVSWTSPQTFAQNPNSNALRWGTMYNFWFDANRGPTTANTTLGLFKPHTPQSVTIALRAPAPPPAIPGDLNGDGHVDLTDLALLLADYGCGAPPCPGDTDGDGDTDLADLATLLGNFGI
jgi:hypothetical protein